VVIYKASREFFEEESSAFVSFIGALMPGFLIWSALTVKESWLILFGISTFYATWRFTRERHPVAAVFYMVLASVLVLLTLAFRFYAAGFLLLGIVVTLMSYRSKRPVLGASYGLAGIVLVYLLLHSLNVVQLDLVTISQSRIDEMASFRANLSDPSQPGSNSAIQFDYDTTTATGAGMMLLVGSVYVLLSPFPWQVTSLSQAAALPDTFLWWWLVFYFIVPGFRYAWNKRPAVVLSIVAFVVPLFLFYAFMFGNVGLAYRQRAQLLPFLLIVAAAGYEYRQREKRNSSREASASPKTVTANRPFPATGPHTETNPSPG